MNVRFSLYFSKDFHGGLVLVGFLVLLLAQDVVYSMQDVAVVYGMLKVKGSKS